MWVPLYCSPSTWKAVCPFLSIASRIFRGRWARWSAGSGSAARCLRFRKAHAARSPRRVASAWRSTSSRGPRWPNTSWAASIHRRKIRSDSLEIPDRSLIHHVPSVERRVWLDEHHVHFVRQSFGAVLDAVGHDDELARPQVPVPVAQLHPQPALDDKKQLVFPLVVVPDELSPELHAFHVRIIQFAHDFWRPVLSDASKLLLQVYDFHLFPPYCPLPGRVSGGMVRPRAESLMSAASRFRLVSSLFALMTHQIAVFRYQGAWAWKKRQARLLARSL